MSDGHVQLLSQILDGSVSAWQRFFVRFGPQVEAIARNSRALGSLRQDIDDCRTVMTRVFERLRRDDFRALRLYLDWQERNQDRSFDDWLAVVTTNVARDYVEERLGASRDQPIKRLINTLAGALDDDDQALAVSAHITPRLLAQQILEYARKELPALQVEVLETWLSGHDYEDIASKLGLTDGTEAKRLLRAGLARLRRNIA